MSVEIAKQIASSTPTSWIVALSTTITGVATEIANEANWFSWIPDDIGKLASLFGLVLVVLLIYSRTLIIRIDRIDLEDKEKKKKDDNAL